MGDYPDDPRLGSAKVYHKLREEFRALGHPCDLLLAPQLGARPAGARLRWLVGPALAERAVARAFAAGGAYDVVDVASAEGSLLGLRRRLGAHRGAALVSRSHGLEHLNFRRMLDDHRAGLAPKPWHRRLWYPAARLSQVALAARAADRLLVLNEGDRAFALERGWKAPGQVELVPHGVSQGVLEAAPPPDAPRGRGLLFCGSWDRMKGIDYLAEAMGIMARTPAPPRLTVLGPGAAEAEVLAAFPAHARALVAVVPRTGEEEVMRHFREHDLLLQASTYEGFGMVVPEALSQRLPVVATAQGAAASLLADGRAGVLVPVRDARALAGAALRLLGDAPLRRRMGDAGHQAVRAMTWTATARRTLEAYAAAREEGA